MSSQASETMATATKPRPGGEIELTVKFSDQMYKLCMNSDYSDVTFIVEGCPLPAHKVILAARSEYFRALLFGGMSESNQQEIKMEIPLVAFKALLKYVYCGRMSLDAMKEEHILDTLGLADQFGFTELEFAISEYLIQILSVNNCCAILDAARLYRLENLINVCHTFMDRNAKDLLNHQSFLTLSQDSLCGILSRNSFFAPEVMIFVAVKNWCRKNSECDFQSVVKNVRLPLMKLEQLLNEVRSSGIIESDRLLDAINEQTTSKRLPYRGALWPEENIATSKFESKTIQGDLRSSLLDGDTVSYDGERGFTRHQIQESGDKGIVVELGTISIINHIKVLLWDRDPRSYSYYIEVCVNPHCWERVVNYQQYLCRSWQFLYFPARAVKFIRLVGTHNTANKVFHVVSLEAMYTANFPAIKNDIVAPTYNVATVEMSASVIEGVSRSRNALLNGDVKNYDWDSGYTCHQLGSGVILIQLGQPYYIGSLRLLLWDLDDRTYSFYIETSVNQSEWQTVVDKTKDHLRSWQQFTFPPRPVVFIKIVGTDNTANEIFHCVHFECPSQDTDYRKNLEIELKELDSVEEECVVPGASCSSAGQTTEKTESRKKGATKALRDLMEFNLSGEEEEDDKSIE